MVIEPAVVLASTPLVPVIANVPVPPATPMVVLAVSRREGYIAGGLDGGGRANCIGSKGNVSIIG